MVVYTDSDMAKKYNYTKKTGRPSKFNTVNLEQLKKLYLAGWDDARVAGFFNFTRKSLENWKKDNAEFFLALKDWKKDADKRVERSLYDRAVGYSHEEEVIYQYQGKIIKTTTIKQYAPDVTAQIFWLKNRQPENWRDKTEHDVNVNPLDILRVTDKK